MKFISNSKVNNHKSQICGLLEWAEKCVLCTSFIDKKGFNHLSKSICSGIEERGLNITVYSNGEAKYTKQETINLLSSVNGLVHKVTRGKRRLHSKIYYFEKGLEFIVIIGSANITHNGLVKNIELSTQISGDIGSHEHQEILSQLLQVESEC